MLTSLRGVYKNGEVYLTEPAPTTVAPVPVVVVFLEPESPHGFIEVAADASLELAQTTSHNERMDRLRASWERAREEAPSMKGPTLSEEVLADRADEESKP